MPSARPDGVGEPRELRDARLLGAYDQLATALETVDLAREPELAEELVRALRATDRACAVDGRAGGPGGEPRGKRAEGTGGRGREATEDVEAGPPPDATRTTPDGGLRPARRREPSRSRPAAPDDRGGR